MDVDEYLRLSNLKDTLLYTLREAGDSIQVHEHAGERWVYTGEHSILSMMRLDAPADPVFPNHVAMLAALLFRDDPRSVLNLGFGTGAFERFFTDRLPDTTVVSVDTSAALAGLARSYFHIPQDWPVIVRPADEFLHDNTQQYDLLLCDIFNGDRHPDCLCETGFYADAASSLAPGGVMAINLSPTTEEVLLEILVAMRRSFASVLLVNLVDYGNVVLYAMQHPPVNTQEQHKRAQLLGTRLRLDLHSIPGRLTRLPETPFTGTGKQAGASP